MHPQQDLPRKPVYDSKALLILGCVEASTRTGTILNDYTEIRHRLAQLSGRGEWISGVIKDPRTVKRRVASITNITEGLLSHGKDGFALTSRGSQLVGELGQTATIIVDPSKQEFNLDENFGLFYINSLEPKPAYLGSLIGAIVSRSNRGETEAGPSHDGSIQAVLRPE